MFGSLYRFRARRVVRFCLKLENTSLKGLKQEKRQKQNSKNPNKDLSYLLLRANSTNTKCRPFHIKINCSKFRIDRLQQLCHVIFLIYLFVTSRNYYCLVYFCGEKLLQSYEK